MRYIADDRDAKPFKRAAAVENGAGDLALLDAPFGIARCDQWVSSVCDSLVSSALRYMAARSGFLPVPAGCSFCRI